MFKTPKESIITLSLIWWICILLLAYIFTSKYISLKALFIFSGSIISFVSFFLIYNSKSKNKVIFDKTQISLKIESIFLFFSLAILLYLSIRSYSVQSEYLMFYRDIYFNEPEKIFGSILMGELFNKIFIPLFYLLLILSIVRVDYRKKNIFMGFGCLIFLSYITQGRFPIYHMLYFALIFLIINGLNIKIKNLMYLSLSSMLIVFISLALFISRLEIDLSLMNIEFMIDLFLKYFINYHFVGLYIFDSILENSMYATRTFYGCNSIGFVGDIARRIEEIFIGTQTINDCYRANNDFFLQGQYIEGLDGRYNAFGTNMMPLYLDGGWVGVLSFSSLLGFLCAKMKCPEEMVVNPIFLLINFVVVFGAFQSLISDPIFQATLIIFFFYNYLIKFINKLYDV